MSAENEVEETEDDVRVRINLRNQTGEADTVEIRQHILGLTGYILISAEEEEDVSIINIEASHTTLQDLVELFELLRDVVEDQI